MTIPSILTWDYLLNFDCNPPTVMFSRTQETLDEYSKFKDKLIEANKTLPEHIVDKYFTSDDTKFAIVPNDFPYTSAEGIQHVLIWFNPNDTELNSLLPKSFNHESNKAYVESLLYKDERYNGKEFVMWENLASNKSIQEIRHIQIFVKMND